MFSMEVLTERINAEYAQFQLRKYESDLNTYITETEKELQPMSELDTRRQWRIKLRALEHDRWERTMGVRDTLRQAKAARKLHDTLTPHARKAALAQAKCRSQLRAATSEHRRLVQEQARLLRVQGASSQEYQRVLPQVSQAWFEVETARRNHHDYAEMKRVEDKQALGAAEALAKGNTFRHKTRPKDGESLVFGSTLKVGHVQR